MADTLGYKDGYRLRNPQPISSHDRLYLTGPCRVISEACRRLGSDAVGELRGMIGERDPGA
jgi:hypothetical protein